MQIWLKNHNFFDIYTSQKCSFIPLCLDFTKFGTLSIYSHKYKKSPDSATEPGIIVKNSCPQPAFITGQE